MHTQTCSLHASDYASFYIAIFLATATHWMKASSCSSHHYQRSFSFVNLEPIKEDKQFIVFIVP